MMITGRRFVRSALLLLLIWPAACAPTPGEIGISQGPEIFVFPSATEDRMILSEDIFQNNCDGTAEASDTVERSHTVLRIVELGSSITVDAGGQAGIPGIGSVGVGAAVANHYDVSYGSQETVRRAITVAAGIDSNIQHTIRHFEVWETGEMLIVAGGVNQRIPYSFRRDFRMERLPPANLGCLGGQQTTTQGASSPTIAVAGAAPNPAQPELVDTQTPAPTAAPPTTPVQSFCPFLTNGHIEQLRGAASVSDALHQAEEFAGHQQNDYKEGSTIPAGVVIATDLQNSDLSQFPVSPIRNQGGWGLFVTTDAFIAPNDGTYWCIQ
jgi:hypothetical protein